MRCTKCAEGKCNGSSDDSCMDYREPQDRFPEYDETDYDGEDE